jgi:threonine dehydrogenase-like Zn-dependent dehydrogenase
VTNNTTAATVAIIGAGGGGLYLVAELGVAGFKLRLHDIDDSKLSDIRARGGLEVEGEKARFAAVERVTSDLGPAVDGADVIIVVTGGNTQAVVARSLAPLLRDGQVILLIQGNTGGGYAYAMSGRKEEAIKIVDGLEARHDQNPSADADIALIYVGLGARDQAMISLNKAYEVRFKASILLRPAFDPLRSDARFQDLLRRIGLPHGWWWHARHVHGHLSR